MQLAYWSKGYTHLPAAAGGLPPTPFALHYVRLAWTHSLLWRPSVLILLLPLAVVGTLAVQRTWWRWLLWLATLTTAAFYSVYSVTDIHPRFMYVVFPFVLVLWSAGVIRVLEPVFWLFGSSWPALRIVPIALTVVSALLLWRVGRRIMSERAAVASAALLWVWPPFAVYELVHQHGFYATDVLYSALLLLLSLRLVERPSRPRVATVGFVLGLTLGSRFSSSRSQSG